MIAPKPQAKAQAGEPQQQAPARTWVLRTCNNDLTSRAERSDIEIGAAATRVCAKRIRALASQQKDAAR